MLKYELDQVKFAELKDKIAIPKFQRGLVWGDGKKKEFASCDVCIALQPCEQGEEAQHQQNVLVCQPLRSAACLRRGAQNRHTGTSCRNEYIINIPYAAGKVKCASGGGVLPACICTSGPERAHWPEGCRFKMQRCKIKQETRYGTTPALHYRTIYNADVWLAEGCFFVCRVTQGGKLARLF